MSSSELPIELYFSIHSERIRLELIWSSGKRVDICRVQEMFYYYGETLDKFRNLSEIVEWDTKHTVQEHEKVFRWKIHNLLQTHGNGVNEILRYVTTLHEYQTRSLRDRLDLCFVTFESLLKSVIPSVQKCRMEYDDRLYSEMELYVHRVLEYPWGSLRVFSLTFGSKCQYPTSLIPHLKLPSSVLMNIEEFVLENDHATQRLLFSGSTFTKLIRLRCKGLALSGYLLKLFTQDISEICRLRELRLVNCDLRNTDLVVLCPYSYTNGPSELKKEAKIFRRSKSLSTGRKSVWTLRKFGKRVHQTTKAVGRTLKNAVLTAGLGTLAVSTVGVQTLSAYMSSAIATVASPTIIVPTIAVALGLKGIRSSYDFIYKYYNGSGYLNCLNDLEIFDLSGNRIVFIYPVINHFTNLRELYLRDNQLGHYDETLWSKFASLFSSTTESVMYRAYPLYIYPRQLHSLQVLDISGNVDLYRMNPEFVEFLDRDGFVFRLERTEFWEILTRCGMKSPSTPSSNGLYASCFREMIRQDQQWTLLQLLQNKPDYSFSRRV